MPFFTLFTTIRPFDHIPQTFTILSSRVVPRFSLCGIRCFLSTWIEIGNSLNSSLHQKSLDRIDRITFNTSFSNCFRSTLPPLERSSSISWTIYIMVFAFDSSGVNFFIFFITFSFINWCCWEDSNLHILLSESNDSCLLVYNSEIGAVERIRTSTA